MMSNNNILSAAVRLHSMLANDNFLTIQKLLKNIRQCRTDRGTKAGNSNIVDNSKMMFG